MKRGAGMVSSANAQVEPCSLTPKTEAMPTRWRAPTRTSFWLLNWSGSDAASCSSFWTVNS